MPFLRRRQENEPGSAAPEPAPAAPATAPPVEAPVGVEPLQAPEPQAEQPVASQFQPVEGADEMLDMPLGTLIFRAGLIAPQQLEDALAEGLRSGKRLGEVLLSRSWLSEDDLSRLLAGQKGLPYADLSKIAIDRELAQAMSYDDARAEMALPIVTEFGLPVVAMADPDEAAMERLRAKLGPEVRFVVAAPSVIARLIDEILGGAPAPGLVVAPSAAEQYPPDDLPAEEPVPPEAAPEPEPVALDSTAEEASAPELAAQEVRPIIAEGEVDYPTFSEYQPLPQPEAIARSEEQLPEEVQSGEYGYYDDPSLLEGSAWQAGETGPTAPESEIEATDLSADEQGAPIETEQQPIEAEQQPLETEQPVAEVWEAPAEEAYPEAAPEPVAEDTEESALEQPPAPVEEAASSSSGEEEPVTTTPAWMRGEVNVITADVADFIDSGASAPVTEPPAESGNLVEGEAGPIADGGEVPAESEPTFEVEPDSAADDIEAAEMPSAETEVAEPKAFEPVENEPTEAEPGYTPPAWAGEVVEAAEQAEAAGFTDASPEPAGSQAAGEEEPGAKTGTSEYELVLRLVDGDRISIGTHDSIEEAQQQAGEVAKQFAETKDGGWPFIAGRFLRPETIVSIDIEQHGTGWGGSGSRGRMFSGDENA